MIYTTRIQKAIRFATKTHEVYQKQKRKGKDIPYIAHPLAVGLLLARSQASEDLIVAGILHDTIEESIPTKKVTREMLATRFGTAVADLVDSVTEKDKVLSWEERKRDALQHISTFTNEQVLLKSADVICNLTELIADYQDGGEKIFERFNAPKSELISHAIKVIQRLHARWPENPLAADLTKIEQSLTSIKH